MKNDDKLPLEGWFNQHLTKTFENVLANAVVIKHADRFRFGVPDFSITMNRQTGWLETKVSDRWPKIKKMRGIQRLTCQCLHHASDGRCWIVVFDVHRDVRRTSLVDPRFVTRDLVIEQVIAQYEGWDYLAVADFVREQLR